MARKKNSNRVLLMFIDMILSLISAVISYFLIGTVGEGTYTQVINVSFAYLPICSIFAMTLVGGYETNLRHTNIYDFLRYTLAMAIAGLGYIAIDLVMGYPNIIIFKLFAVVCGFVLMMFARVVYAIVSRNSNRIRRIEDNKVRSNVHASDIDFDELLEDYHTKVRLDVDATRFFNGKTVLITGAGGSVGSNLYKKVIKLGASKVVGVDIYENSLYELKRSLDSEDYGTEMAYEIASIRDYKKMNEIFAKYRPDIVYHAAAHKHVPLMEANPEEAVKNNVFGTYTVSKLADIYNVEKFIFISTDKAHNPCGVMGATKRIGEMIMNYMANKSRATRYITLRFCNIVGSNASVIPLMCSQIEKGGPVLLTDKKASRYFISTKEAINYIINMTIKTLTSDIYILDIDKQVPIRDLAHKLIKAYGLKPNVDIDIVYSGLRDGERISEHLIPRDALPIADRVYKLQHERMNGRAFYRKLNLLNVAARENDRDNIIKIMSDIIPEYDSKYVNNGNNKTEYSTIANVDEFVG